MTSRAITGGHSAGKNRNLVEGSIHEQLDTVGIEELRYQAEPDPWELARLDAASRRLRENIAKKELARLDAASRALQETFEEKESVVFTHSGWCMSGLPHRRPASNNAIWHRQNGRLHLLVEPGTILHQGQIRTVGVPFGPIARIVLIYIQTRVGDDGVVPLGANLRRWMNDLRLPSTGPVIRRLREQALRLSRARVSLHWTDARGTSVAVADHSPIHLWTGMDPELRKWSECLVLSPSYHEALRKHRVPLADHAVAYLQGSSLALDLYLWLAYRLKDVEPSGRLVTWRDLATQLGANYQREVDLSRHIQHHLKDVLDVYPEAEVEVKGSGLLLWNSPTPVPRRRK